MGYMTGERALSLSLSRAAFAFLGFARGYHGLVTRGRLRAGEWLLAICSEGSQISLLCRCECVRACARLCVCVCVFLYVCMHQKQAKPFHF